MSKTRRGLSFLLCLVMAFSLFAGVPFKVLDTEANAADTNTNPGNNSEWVTAWHTSMLYLDADSDVQRAVTALSNYNERTFRTVIPMTIVGNTVRLTYSNEYATAENGEELKIGEITLAKGDPSDTARWADTKYVAVKDLAEVFKTAIAQVDINVLAGQQIVVGDTVAEDCGNIVFNAYLTQSAGFTDALDAWNNSWGK